MAIRSLKVREIIWLKSIQELKRNLSEFQYEYLEFGSRWPEQFDWPYKDPEIFLVVKWFMRLGSSNETPYVPYMKKYFTKMKKSVW